jgi:hypothetical protein|nr:unknown [Zea mays]
MSTLALRTIPSAGIEALATSSCGSTHDTHEHVHTYKQSQQHRYHEQFDIYSWEYKILFPFSFVKQKPSPMIMANTNSRCTSLAIFAATKKITE